jgi:hypothetical protein
MMRKFAFLGLIAQALFVDTRLEDKPRGLPKMDNPPSPPSKKYLSSAEKARRAKRRGHKKFTIEGQTTYALNERNARRKLGLT